MTPNDGSVALAGSKQDGIWAASTLGVSFHCECGWVSKRYETEEAAIEAEVGAHMEEHRG